MPIDVTALVFFPGVQILVVPEANILFYFRISDSQMSSLSPQQNAIRHIDYFGNRLFALPLLNSIAANNVGHLHTCPPQDRLQFR
ncbi:hypothetical protein Nepgr_026976 [Nepenthes gracilis]|uniref:Uncharacterized protein n=1 Tax=Nepenthes gracilis TaxID=150966 RepID=A0AAD3T9L8_NEPGR|nr:hypothetical protein Nepgr_026976 [Nepenthes gracilis]